MLLSMLDYIAGIAEAAYANNNLAEFGLVVLLIVGLFTYLAVEAIRWLRRPR